MMNHETEFALNVCRDIGLDLFENGRDIGGSALERHLKSYTWFAEAEDVLGRAAALAEVRRAYNESSGVLYETD